MPRTTTLEAPGCPPFRALTFDVLGLVKVVEARSNQGGIPKVVVWGKPDASQGVLAASSNDHEFDPVRLVAVARKSGLVEVLSPINGDVHASIPNISQSDIQPQDAIAGLYMFRKHRSKLSSRSCTLLTCTIKGHASLRSVEVPEVPGDSLSRDTPTTWNVCGAGDIVCCEVDGSENYALFGGKGVEVNVWDLENCTKIWNAKSPAKNSLGIFTPTWFTSATFLNKDDHRKFVAGTNSHQVRLYDISAQRRPVISFNFRETPIKAVAEDLDGNTVYVGNGSGDLASVDIRTGLDSYLRIWDIKSRQLLSAVFLKQHLTNVVFDSHIGNEEIAVSGVPLPPKEQRDANATADRDAEDSDGDAEESDRETEASLPVKRKKKSKEHSGSKKLKFKKRGKRLKEESIDAS
ncbi:hypothetical protein RJ639_026931 [Escallonia herrerae]|uniref:WD repeat-containing protein 74 n=1 Tax=Escallonia herrerae TaxID=1293975 RepID=A0AA88XKJ0_9ASTE|nr:hypothetical protein RJ639_026931 [Escallonia herrerae]